MKFQRKDNDTFILNTEYGPLEIILYEGQADTVTIRNATLCAISDRLSGLYVMLAEDNCSEHEVIKYVSLNDIISEAENQYKLGHNHKPKGKKMKFQYNSEDEALTLKTDNMPVEIMFHGGETDYITVGSLEICTLDDTLHSLHITIQGECFSLYQVLIEATNQYEQLAEETRQEQADERKMEQFLSCPEKTGRI